MKQTEITCGWAETIDLPPSYGNLKPEVSITGKLDEGDDPEEEYNKLLQLVFQRFEIQTKYMAQARIRRDKKMGKVSPEVLVDLAGE